MNPPLPHGKHTVKRASYDKSLSKAERRRIASKAYVARHPERATKARWKYKYGVDAHPSERAARCQICGEPPGKLNLALDHCHASGKFRGWLCKGCNTGLGMFKDNPALLRMAANYIEIAELIG